jgi:hypothetical protein
VVVLCKSQRIFEDFATFILKEILPGHIHRSGRICLRHLGDIW